MSEDSLEKTMSIDLSKVDRITERKRIAELHARREQIDDERHEACAEVRRQKSAAAEPLWIPFREQVKAVEAPFVAEEARLSASYDAEIEAIDAELEALPSLKYDDEYLSSFECEITGLVILEDDEFVRDEETGECFLRAVLPLPGKDAA